jgi:hypothetical protein
MYDQCPVCGLPFHRAGACQPDYVDVVIHSYRHRMNLADGFPRYADIERRLATLPAISVPTITLDGDADGVIAATDGKSSVAIHPASASYRSRRGTQPAARSARAVRGRRLGTGSRAALTHKCVSNHASTRVSRSF